MTDRHPGGLSITLHLLEISGLVSLLSESFAHGDAAGQVSRMPFRILDMGAGDGQTVRLLQDMGFAAEGIDRHPGTDAADLSVHTGDFLHCPYPDEVFDAVCSECAFYISGDAPMALKEAARLLKKHGRLLLADVSFVSPESHIRWREEAGFSVLTMEDITPQWKEYYISCIWDGAVDQLCGCFPKGKYSYYLTICERM